MQRLTAFLVLFLSSLAAFPAWAKNYIHPLGFSFQYPDDWNVRESAFTTFELVPPNVASNERGPTESYFMMAFGVHTLHASNPRLVEEIEGLIKQIAPFLVPKGDIELLRRPANSAVMRWRGSSPTGTGAGADVYVLPSSSVCLALVAIGEEGQIQTRAAAVRSIFASFRLIPGEKDVKLSAAWENSADHTYMHLRKDGSFLATQSGTETQTSPQTQTSEESQTAGGRWFAGDGKLFLVADNSTPLIFRYELRGVPGERILVLRDASGQEQDLQESKKH